MIQYIINISVYTYRTYHISSFAENESQSSIKSLNFEVPKMAKAMLLSDYSKDKCFHLPSPIIPPNMVLVTFTGEGIGSPSWLLELLLSPHYFLSSSLKKLLVISLKFQSVK
jgi:hypothetical protein